MPARIAPAGIAPACGSATSPCGHRPGIAVQTASAGFEATGVSYEPEGSDSVDGSGRPAAPYTQRELESMMADLESDLVERKESLRGDNPRKIRQAVCVFANDLPDHQRPGVVFVGADDAGAPVGLEITDELLLQLADVKTDGNIVPPPTLTVDRRVLFGTPVAVVTVMPSDAPPVRHRGRTWIRVGPRRAVASAQDERILNEKRRHRDPHFDAQPVPTASVADLDLRRFEEEYLPQAVDATALAENDRSTEERLAAMKMIAGVEDPRPTIAGILVLGKNPQDFLPAAVAQFLRIAGTDLADPVVDDGRCSGPIANLLRSLDDKLLAHNRIAVDFTSGPVEVRMPTYPMAALQQLVRNAVMHRTYEGTNAPIYVYWFDDRIEITNPGGPYGALTAENFGAAGHRGLPQPDSGGGDAGPRTGSTLRRGHPDGATGSAEQWAGGTRLPRRAELGAVHGGGPHVMTRTPLQRMRATSATTESPPGRLAAGATGVADARAAVTAPPRIRRALRRCDAFPDSPHSRNLHGDRAGPGTAAEPSGTRRPGYCSRRTYLTSCLGPTSAP